jgi:E3 ubiquitin-protein ligase UBR4
MVVGSNLLLSKTVQSVVQKYTIECKAKFDELSKIILKLNLCRKELREYDKQFKSNGHSANGNGGNLTSMCASEAVSRKNSTAAGASATEVKQLTRLQSHLSTLAKLQQTKSTCFGCAAAAIEHCLTLFRVFLCSAHMQQQPQLLQHVRSELCRHNILEELVNFG